MFHPMLNHLLHSHRAAAGLWFHFCADISFWKAYLPTLFFFPGLNLVLPKQSQAVPPQSLELAFSRETSGRGSMCRAPAHTPNHAGPSPSLGMENTSPWDREPSPQQHRWENGWKTKSGSCLLSAQGWRAGVRREQHSWNTHCCGIPPMSLFWTRVRIKLI